MMWNWIKDKWGFAVSGLVVLFVFVLGRKSKEKQVEVAEKAVELKEKEIEIEKELSSAEKLELAKAHQKYINSRIALRKRHRTSTVALERETIIRKLELIEQAKEDPDEIDRILMEEFNIAKLK